MRYLFTKSLIIFCVFAAIFINGYTQESFNTDIKEPAVDEVKYNENYSLACHNCYDSKYSSELEEVFSYTNTIELDIWDSEIFYGFWNDWVGGSRMESDWYVKHDPDEKGNANCFKGSFKKSLERLNKWSLENPGHDVVTVFIDKKENWSGDNESRKPSDIDELIVSVLGKEKIYTPAELRHSNKNLKQSVPGSWPELNMLKDKFIFVITDAAVGSRRSVLNEYLDARRSDAVCFVAPKINNEKEIARPLGISHSNSGNIVFYNLHYSGRELSEELNSRGYISRVYGSPEVFDVYTELIEKKVNFVAMYNYKLK